MEPVLELPHAEVWSFPLLLTAPAAWVSARGAIFFAGPEFVGGKLLPYLYACMRRNLLRFFPVSVRVASGVGGVTPNQHRAVPALKPQA